MEVGGLKNGMPSRIEPTTAQIATDMSVFVAFLDDVRRAIIKRINGV